MTAINLTRYGAPARYLVVRIRRYPKGPDPYGADVKGGPAAGRGTTPDGAVRSLRNRLTDRVRRFGLPAELAAAPLDEQTILTWLPGAFAAPTARPAELTLRAVRWDLRGVVTALSDAELRGRARAVPSDQFEEGFLHDFPPGWDAPLAEAFNRFLAGRNGQRPKPVAVSIRRGCSLLGEHGPDLIRLQRGLPPLKAWQVFLHEVAHYRVPHHRRSFALELARVYGLWREWFATRHADTRA